MRPLGYYVERIAALQREHPGCEVRVRVTPQEQFALMPHIGSALMDVDLSTQQFAWNQLGAAEWVWDNTVTEPVFERISSCPG